MHTVVHPNKPSLSAPGAERHRETEASTRGRDTWAALCPCWSGNTVATLCSLGWGVGLGATRQSCCLLRQALDTRRISWEVGLFLEMPSKSIGSGRLQWWL